jgi:hypothetical protein
VPVREAVRADTMRSAREAAWGTPGRWVALSLARVEGRRLLRQPLVVLGAAAAPAAVYLVTRRSIPVMHRDGIFVPPTLIPLAAATFLGANMATLRARRDGAAELFESTATRARMQTLGQVLSVAWPVGLSVVLTVLAVGVMVAFDAVGRPSTPELMVGPALVALCGVVGVALGRWLPFSVAGPVGLVVFLAFQVSLALGLGFVSSSMTSGAESRVRWLAAWAPLAAFNVGDPARELVIRPAGSHLLYLVGLVVVVASLALLRHGWQPAVTVLGIASLALTMVAGGAQLRSPSAEQRAELVTLMKEPDRHQVCEVRAGARFCAFPAYLPWIDRWAQPVTSVLAHVPPEATPAVLVRQQLEGSYGTDLPQAVVHRIAQGWYSGLGGEVAMAVGTWWPRGEEEADHHLALAMGTAAWAVGLPPTPDALSFSPEELERAVDLAPPGQRSGVRRLIEREDWYACSAAGQARAVVALWLTGRAMPDTEQALREADRLNPYGLVGPGPNGVEYLDLLLHVETSAYYLVTGRAVGLGSADAAFALQLLDRPEAEVAAALERQWQTLVDPATTTDDLVVMLGLRPLPTLEELAAEAGGGDRVLRRFRRFGSFAWQGMIPCP